MLNLGGRVKKIREKRISLLPKKPIGPYIPQEGVEKLHEFGIPTIGPAKSGVLFGEEAEKAGRRAKRKETIKNIGETIGSLFKAIPELFTKETKEEYQQGVLGAVSVAETTLGVAAKEVAKGLPQYLALDPRLALIPKEKAKEKVNEMSDKFLKQATKDYQLSQTLTIEDPRKFLEKIKDPKFIAKGVARNLPNLMISAGVGIVGNLVGGPIIGGVALFGTGGMLEGGYAYQEAASAGLSHEEAVSVAGKVGIVNGILESLPIAGFLNRTGIGGTLKKRLIRAIVRDVIFQTSEEGGTEGLQEIWSNVIARSYDENRDLLQGVPESVFFGALLGGGMGLGGGVITNVKPSVGLTIEEVEPEVPEVKPEVKKPEPVIPKELESLAVEARKFKSVEKFLKKRVDKSIKKKLQLDDLEFEDD